MPVLTDNSAAVLRGHNTCAVRMTTATSRNSLRDSPQSFAAVGFDLFAVLTLTNDMMKTPGYAMIESNREARTAAIAGSRMLVLEEMFDALVDALIASGAIPQNAASVMLEHLAERFIEHSAGRTKCEWQIDQSELRDQAARLRSLGANRRGAAESQATLESAGREAPAQ
jgi:hypothetical protein